MSNPLVQILVEEILRRMDVAKDEIGKLQTENVRLRARLEEAEACLRRGNYKPSADGETWVPPVNEYATRFYRLREAMTNISSVTA